MTKSNKSNLVFIKTVLGGAAFFSILALIFHIRWFIPFILYNANGIVPSGEVPGIWYVVQICNNVIFLITCFLLVRLVNRYEQTGYFDSNSLKAFNGMIICCVVLGLTGWLQIVANNIYELHFSEWTSLASVTNLIFRSFTRLLIFREPQTMYFLLAIILWAVKQFVTKALIVKQENESFV